jgi:hypothetical protein
VSRHGRNLRELTRHAESLGWTGKRTGSDHIRWTHPEVPEALVTALTPGGDYLKIEKARFARRLEQARAGTLPTRGKRLARSATSGVA